MCFPAPYTRAASHTQTAPSMSTILTHPRDFPRVLAPFSHTFPRLPHTVTKLQKPSSNFNETSVSGPANQAPVGLHEFPASTAGAVPHVQTEHQPAETSGRSTQMRVRPTYSNSLRRRGGHGRQGTAPLRDAATTAATLTTRSRGCVVVRRRAGMVLGPNLASRYVEFWPGYGRWQTNDPASSCGKP